MKVSVPPECINPFLALCVGLLCPSPPCHPHWSLSPTKGALKSIDRTFGLITQNGMLLETASYPSFRKIPTHGGRLLPPLVTCSRTSRKLISHSQHLPLDLKLSTGSDLPRVFWDAQSLFWEIPG